MSGASALLVALLLGAPASDWTLPRGDEANRAFRRFESLPDRPARAWTFELQRLPFGYRPGISVWSSPAVGALDGRAVVAAGACDHNLYLLDAASGEELWHTTTGGGIYEAPLLWNDGGDSWLFATSADRSVTALDARTGERRWSRSLADYAPTQGGAFLSAAGLGLVAGEPALFVGSWVWDKSLAHHRQEAALSALAARSGRVLWRTPFLDSRVSAPLYARLGGRGFVWAASADGNLRALDAEDGRVVWTHREPEPIASSPALWRFDDGARLYIGSHFGKLRCLRAETGEQLWAFKAGHWITAPPVVYEDQGRVWVAFGAFDGRIHALDALSGEPRWSARAFGPVHASAALVAGGAEPTLVFAAWDHQLHALSGTDGTVLWQLFVGAPAWDGISQGDSPWSSPAAAWVGDRWMIYYGSASGTFYGLPFSQAAQGGPSPPWTGFRFWITMGLVLATTAGIGLWLSRRRGPPVGRETTR